MHLNQAGALDRYCKGEGCSGLEEVGAWMTMGGFSSFKTEVTVG